MIEQSEIKRGAILMCMNNGRMPVLIVGNLYVCLEDSYINGHAILLIADAGGQIRALASRFKLILP